MCVTSMVMEAKQWEWQQRYPPLVYPPPLPYPTPQEIAEFRRLLDRAKEYDRKNNEPDCEMEEKRAALKKIAEKMGVAIDFV